MTWVLDKISSVAWDNPKRFATQAEAEAELRKWVCDDCAYLCEDLMLITTACGCEFDLFEEEK